ncbi:hypothetical protein [Dactylosporangium sp. CA-233914]|uniref:hypothetical protein n=1 Tax=Dactylosporangium sp. CA-233914 TaxID=3239934 RepID=UPI003D8C6462
MTKFRRRRVGFVFQDYNLPLRLAGPRADGKRVREVLALLPSGVDQYGRTVVMATHNPVAASYAGTVVSRGSTP